MNKICTSLEQSNKLIELGIDVNTADMHYSTWTILNGEYILSPNQGETIEELQEDYGNQVIPAWSLTALLDILPSKTGTSSILIRDSRTGKYKCVHGSIFSNSYEESIDAVFELVCQLLENKEKL